ncbi:MAG: BolA family transcriptional regulator [Methylococcales symbiont of Iophon sp. n. MRB-2018]|nr:MAG: BolA family transcriptional regulator [Methylococcales symbiont of Iophon sp. n. MRB-2018]KAF3980505.1 MAG: BolA family transcriptional regulator [Methylococcales symbiont of Iophon sp. n. MRB-2018]
MIADLIKQQLTTALKPDSIELIDDSAAHAGHTGAKGGGHYNVTIVAQIFDGKSLLQRHQLIYQALSGLMKKDIHALGINALTPSENT